MSNIWDIDAVLRVWSVDKVNRKTGVESFARFGTGPVTVIDEINSRPAEVTPKYNPLKLQQTLSELNILNCILTSYLVYFTLTWLLLWNFESYAHSQRIE